MQCWASDPTLRFSGGLWYSLPGNHHFYNNLHIVIWVLRCFTTARAKELFLSFYGPIVLLPYLSQRGRPVYYDSLQARSRERVQTPEVSWKCSDPSVAFKAGRLIQTPWRQESSLLTPCGRKDVGDPFTQASGVRFREDREVPSRRGLDASQRLGRLACP